MDIGDITAIANSDGSVDLIGRQGKTWELTVERKNGDGSPFDLTGFSARGQVRKSYDAASSVAAFTCSIVEPPSSGKVKVYMPHATTAGIPCGKKYSDSQSSYVYDVEIHVQDNVHHLIGGKLQVIPEATK